MPRMHFRWLLSCRGGQRYSSFTLEVDPVGSWASKKKAANCEFVAWALSSQDAFIIRTGNAYHDTHT